MKRYYLGQISGFARLGCHKWVAVTVERRERGDPSPGQKRKRQVSGSIRSWQVPPNPDNTPPPIAGGPTRRSSLTAISCIEAPIHANGIYDILGTEWLNTGTLLVAQPGADSAQCITGKFEVLIGRLGFAVLGKRRCGALMMTMNENLVSYS